MTVQADGMDPCDLRLEHGDAAVRDLVARRVPLFEFAIRACSIIRPGNHRGPVAALDAAAPIIARIKDKGLRKGMPVNLDRWLGLLDEEFIWSPGSRPRRGAARGTKETRNGHHGPFSQNKEARTTSVIPSSSWNGRRSSSRCNGPGCADRNSMRSAPSAFTVPVHQAVFTLIAACGGMAAGGSSARAWAARLREEAPNERAQAFVTRLAVEPLVIIASRTRSTPTGSWPGSASSRSAGRSPPSRPGCSA